MGKDTSPHVVGTYWLDKRRDGKSPETWQITWYDERTRAVRYASTRCSDAVAAAKVLDARYFTEQSKTPAQDDPMVIPQLLLYWNEKGKHAIKSDTIASSLRVFIGFLMQDDLTIACRFKQLTPNVFLRFRHWRQAPHSYSVTWQGKTYTRQCKPVANASVQRIIDDIRSAFNHAIEENRTVVKPKLRNIPKMELPSRDTVLTINQLGSIIWYARQVKDSGFLQYIVAQLATACRPDVVKAWVFADQLKGNGLFDIHPIGAKRTKKRNPVVAIPPRWKPYVDEMVANPITMPTSYRRAWRTMRRVLELDALVVPKTIRHTVATYLRNHPRGVPELQISGQLGHLTGNAITAVYAKDLPDPKRRATVVIDSLMGLVFASADQFGAVHLLSKVGNHDLKLEKISH
ncbi:MAG: integrase [Sandarakinorhabdus sp.]